MTTHQKEEILNWSELTEETKTTEELYQSENLEFKDQARQIIEQEVGFSPDISASMYVELRLRASLKRVQEGSLTPEKFDLQKESYARVVKMNIFHDVPHQAHLVDYDKLLQ